MVTILISTAFRCVALIRGEALITGRRLFQWGYSKVRLLEGGAYTRPGTYQRKYDIAIDILIDMCLLFIWIIFIFFWCAKRASVAQYWSINDTPGKIKSYNDVLKMFPLQQKTWWNVMGYNSTRLNLAAWIRWFVNLDTLN